MIYDREGNTVTNTDVSVKKIGSYYAGEYNGTSSYLNIDSVVSSLLSTTTGTWTQWLKPFGTSDAETSFTLTFCDTDANTLLQLYQKV